MEIDEITTNEERALEARRVSRRQLIQHAITLAMQSRWEEAAEANQQLVTMVHGDSEAFNRLGKALTELGRIAPAREAYEQSLKADPANLIAQRNLDRLSRLTDAEAAELTKRAGSKLDPRFFMEETGKTGVTVLQNVAAPEVLATLTAGDQINLEEQDGHLAAVAVDGVRIGEIEPGLGTRLTRLIQTGNTYMAGVVGVDGETVRVIIRETLQSPQNVGKISFPPKKETLPRPYVREGLLRRAASEDEDEDDLDGELRDESTDDDEEDSSEFGFHEGPLDES